MLPRRDRYTIVHDEVIEISSARINAFRETFLARVPSRAHLALISRSSRATRRLSRWIVALSASCGHQDPMQMRACMRVHGLYYDSVIVAHSWKVTRSLSEKVSVTMNVHSRRFPALQHSTFFSYLRAAFMHLHASGDQQEMGNRIEIFKSRISSFPLPPRPLPQIAKRG